jgi:hypothetical protein
MSSGVIGVDALTTSGLPRGEDDRKLQGLVEILITDTIHIYIIFVVDGIVTSLVPYFHMMAEIAVLWPTYL